MAKKYVTQDVYDALKGIASDKNEFEYLTSVGATKEAEGYRVAAKPKYNVVLNYDKDIASNISGMGAAAAKDYLNNFAVARDEKSILGDINLGKYGWANSTTDADRNKFQANTVQYYDELASVNPQLADVVKGWDYNQLNSYIETGKMPEIKKPAPAATPKVRSIWDVADNIVGYKTGYEGGMKNGVSGFDKNYYDAQPLYAELRAMGEEGKTLAAALEGMNAEEATAYIAKNKPIDPKTPEQIASGNNTFFINQGQRGLDTIYDMYTNPNFGQEIRDIFSAYGNVKGGQAAAGAAADNGGNFDSFAEFNKNATNLGYMLAGENAIQNKRHGFADDYFNTGFKTVADALNANAVDFYDYTAAQNQILSDEKKAQWAKEAEMHGYDTERYAIDREHDINMATLEAEKAQQDAQMRMNGYNPDGTPIAGTASGVNYLGTGLSGLVNGGNSYVPAGGGNTPSGGDYTLSGGDYTLSGGDYTLSGGDNTPSIENSGFNLDALVNDVIKKTGTTTPTQSELNYYVETKLGHSLDPRIIEPLYNRFGLTIY